MRTTVSRLAALSIAAAVVAASVAAVAQNGKHGPIPWMNSLEKGRKVAAKQKKPLMADYYAEWCPPCKAMKTTTWTDKAVAERAKRFVPVLVDIDKQRKQADDAKITAVPTVVFYDSRGRELVRSTGYIDSKRMLDLMSEAEKKAKG